MGAFIGRERELSLMNERWAEDGVKGIAVYGRRRIGKTTLLSRFCEGKRAIFFRCIRGSEAENLRFMSIVMTDFVGESRSYETFLDALVDVAAECRKGRTAVVFDEYPYIIDDEEKNPSELQHFIDGLLLGTDTTVVVCGSSMSVMKRETEEADRPLYDRFKTKIELGPLSYGECAAFHPDMPDIDRLKLYLTVGGIPKFHVGSREKTYREYVERHFFSDQADLDDEAAELVGAEFSPLGRYMSVLQAMSNGPAILKEISDRSRVETTACSRCLDGLMNVGIVDTVNPKMGAPVRTRYRIRDPVVAFCCAVVDAWKAVRATRDPSFAYDMMTDRIDAFIGRSFERFCSDYVLDSYRCLDVGTWWRSWPDGRTEEVDIVADVMDGRNKVVLCGECKFRRRGVDSDVLDRLAERVSLMAPQATARLIVFSPYGFTRDMESYAEERGAILVGLDRLVGKEPPEPLRTGPRGRPHSF